MKATALSREKAIELYTYMLKARFFDEKAMELFTAGQIPGFIHVGIGQEAISAGVCLNLEKTDSIFVTHRGHAPCVAKGIDLKLAMAELFGKKTGLCKGKAGSMHLVDKNAGILGASGIVGAGITVATGAALSYQLQGTKQVAVAFFGDGSVNEGTFHEALNMASLWSLPIVYCCENNGWAQFTQQKDTTKVLSVASRAKAYAMSGITVDGNDILAVYEEAGKAIENARKEKGPTLLECNARRWFGHYVGDPQKYRDPKDLEEVRKSDPIARFESYLIEKQVLHAEDISAIKKSINDDLKEAIKFAEESPLPEPTEAMDDLYA